MRQKIVAGNWKMNNTNSESKLLLKKLLSYKFPPDVRVIVSPPYTQLSLISNKLKNLKIEVASQNMHYASNGAFTGEISASMLKSSGVFTTILGHSERRLYFNETNKSLNEKVKKAVNENIEIIFCIGEELDDRKSGNHFEYVKLQLEKTVFLQPIESWKKIIIAYEPIWAIGTGETASPDQVQEMHSYIRNIISENYNESLAESTCIIYGGSVKPSNAKNIFSQPDVDGGLIGGASLKSEDFAAIVKATKCQSYTA
ncbi:MAG: triose-phosphate isomerase [Flavobacteriaceae bacterium]|nr:triose-phosphate isomerase [Flavobacteriaceae bacterium]